MSASPTPLPRWRQPRWIGGALGLGAATLDATAAITFGLTFRIGGWDATPLVWGYLALTLGGLGFALGYVVEARRRERAAAEALVDAQARLGRNDRLAALGQLASTVAHEVRNPLAVIRSAVQTVRDDLPAEADESRESCGFALDEIDRLDHVVRAVLGFARPLRVKAQAVSAAALAARVAPLAERLLRARGLRWQAELCEGAPTAQADLDLACQALLGLIGNAAEASPPGGEVRLRLRADAGCLAVDVEDAGPGVPTELRERVFEPFFTTRREGHGLGLAVVRQIARAHGGGVSVAEAAGGGARFTLLLPTEAPA